jgi:hypothetical protein
LYNYCIDGWSGPTDILEIRDEILIYPNPAGNYIYVNKIVDLTIYNSLGKEVIRQDQTKLLNVSKMSPGVYFIVGVNNGRTFKHTIIKK